MRSLKFVGRSALRAASGMPLLLPLHSRRSRTVHASEISTPDRATVASGIKKEFKTDFAQQMQNKIIVQGQVPLSMFVRDALMHPDYGYYSSKKSVIGGEAADFVTAAEIPFFADVITGWIMDVWQKMGTPRALNLVELGPGKGTLMHSILQQIKHVHPQLLHFLNIHLIELGAARREEQKKKLAEFQTATEKIKWWMDIESLPPSPHPSIILANEFFDALPITRFQYTTRGWLETYVDVDEDPTTEPHFKFIHAPGISWSNYLLPDEIRKKENPILDEVVEMCTYGMQAMELLLKKMVDSPKSALLIIDYGKDETMSDTLRGIRGHKFVSPLLSPGAIDISAWVSFSQLKWALSRVPIANEMLKWHGPIPQSEFLASNGIDLRLASVVRDMETKVAMKYLSAFRRLMDPEEMGESYKVFAVQTSNFPTVSPW